MRDDPAGPVAGRCRTARPDPPWNDRRSPTAARTIAIVAAALSFAWPVSSRAGRPLDTEDAVLIAPADCQIETFARRVTGGPPSRDYGFAPSCNPFGWAEFLIGGERDGVGQFGTVTNGVVQIKTAPRQVTAEQAGWGIEASYDPAYVRGQQRTFARTSFVNGFVSAPLRRTLQLDANLGWSHDWPPAPNVGRDHTTWGVALEQTVTSTIAAVVERTGTDGQNTRTQIGATWTVSPSVTFDAAYGRQRAGSDRSGFVTIGLTVVGMEKRPWRRQ